MENQLDALNLESENVMEKVLQTHHYALEMYAAAFLKEVGSEKASQYQLCNQIRGDKAVWWFEKIGEK